MARGQQILPFVIRPMDWKDLNQVADMEREAFPTLWPGTSYRREMRNRSAEYATGSNPCVTAASRTKLTFAISSRGTGDPLDKITLKLVSYCTAVGAKPISG